MNKIWFLIIGITVVTSCASSYHSFNKKQLRIENKKESTMSKDKIYYSREMIEKQQDEDAKIISTWPEEKKKWFAENFFYKDIFFRNDTLVVVK
ncbi:MAG: hypothetical protein ACOVQG_04810 [Crocinitomicaceae bacterium]|jgi:hypothetical protein